MDNSNLRREAIRRHLMGESVTSICRELEVSRKWFYKWYSRYKTDADEWYKDQSKIPKHCPHKTTEDTEQLVLKIRDKLESTKYAQIGASAIAWHFEKLGMTPPPLWTINRILKRNGKVKPKSKRKNKKSNVKYPYFTEASYPGQIHQVDLVGPRYVKGDGRFYILSTIDRFSHQAHGVPIRSKDDASIIRALIETWQEIGIPDFLQLDNELSFLGSNRYPHSLGKVLKLCLSVNIQPVFIPQGEPWRNGVIEHFNNTLDNKFYRNERFQDYQHLKEPLKVFLRFHNNYHVYSANHGKTPAQVLQHSQIKPVKLSLDFEFSEDQTLPYQSYIHFIRFIRSDLKLRIRGETFDVPPETMYQYVRATVYTEFHQLSVFVDNDLVRTFEYPLLNFNQQNPEEIL